MQAAHKTTGTVVKGMIGLVWGLICGRWNLLEDCLFLGIFPQELLSDDLKNPKESQLGFRRGRVVNICLLYSPPLSPSKE